RGSNGTAHQVICIAARNALNCAPIRWCRPMRLHASVLVPEGFDQHPEQRYPVLFLQTHFDGFPFAFQETPAEAGTNDIGYRLYQDWTSGRLPRMLIVRPTEHGSL
ncbi:MAG TPA: hypothetical protein VK604_13070, partial [Bryobacteraceae bacterium]|nr:hypothetical protein [Bryobacteraceae bacterium]